MSDEADYVVAPGDILAEWIAEQGLTQRDAATACGSLPTSTVKGLLAGTTRLTPVIAAHLNRGTGIGVRFWLSMERKYRAGLAAGKQRAK